MDGADYAPEGVKVMPDGPGLPDTGIQRGTLKDADGDPSTYLYPSSSNNQRIIINHNITVLASTTVDLYFLHYFHLDSSEVVQLVQFKFKIF